MRTAINGIPKERISITVDAELLEKVRIRAEQDDRSLSQYINRVLKKAVREIESEDKYRKRMSCRSGSDDALQ